MAYQEELANRIRDLVRIFPQEVRRHITEKKMFGGIAFLYKEKMTVGVIKDDLMVRVLSNKIDKILAMEHVRPMDFTNRPMKEFIYVSAKGYATGEQLHSWIELGIEHAIHRSKSH
jgi:TfoX/Sxy family transcriptional regulator of competence genes